MPIFDPFQGIRYSASDELKSLTCPPYDVISPQQQDALYDRHPHNAVRLELARSQGSGAERYAEVFDTFRGWVEEGVLAEDDADSFYVYRQDFVDPNGGRARVAGVLGALRLEPFGRDSGVLPHERTMAGPKEDRLALMRACPVNVSPIFSIYRGKAELAPFFDSLEGRPHDARFVDDQRILHRLWRVTAPAEIDMLSSAVAPGPLVIADGHHRYETALAFHDERGSGPGGHDSIMCFCVDADAEGLVVLPYNRALRSPLSPDDIAQRLSERFGAREIPADPAEARAALEASEAEHPFVFVLPERWLLAGATEADVIARTGERHPAWLALDVVALHEAVFPEVFGGNIEELRFSRDPEEIVGLVRQEGFSAGILLRALNATDVVDVAGSGERMPQKASYFWPKAITGLVFRSLAPGSPA